MGGVPVAVAVTWSAVIVAAMSLASRLARSSVGRAAAAALIGISLDLLMEPVAVRAGLWSWTPPGPWLDVPAGNFIGWAVIMGAYTFGAERWGASGPLAAQAVRRLALGGAAVGVLLGVGTVWHALGAERLFSGPRGWAACGLLWAATAAMALRPRPSRVNAPRGSAGEPPERGLAARLGAAGGPLPASVLLLLTAVFATDAMAQGDARLALVALGSAGVRAAGLLEQLLQAGQGGVLGGERLQLLPRRLVPGADLDRGAHLRDRAAAGLHGLVVEAELVVDVGVVGVEAHRLEELALRLLRGARVAGHGDREAQPVGRHLGRDLRQLRVDLDRVCEVRNGHAHLAFHQEVLDLGGNREVRRAGGRHASGHCGGGGRRSLRGRLGRAGGRDGTRFRGLARGCRRGRRGLGACLGRGRRFWSRLRRGGSRRGEGDGLGGPRARGLRRLGRLGFHGTRRVRGRRRLAGQAQHRRGPADDDLDVGLHLLVVPHRLPQRVVTLHLLLEGLDQLVARGGARHLEPALLVQVGRPLELVLHLLPDGVLARRIGLPLERGEQEGSRLHGDDRTHRIPLGILEDAGGQEGVDRLEPGGSEPPRGPGQAPHGDPALGQLQDLLLLGGAPPFEGEGRQGGDGHAAVEVPQAGQDELRAGHGLDAVVEQLVDREADHVLEGDRAAALLEGGHPLGHLEEAQSDAPDLAGHRSPQLVLVHHPGLHERVPEALLVLALHEGGHALEVLVGDAPEGDQRLPQAVLLEVARGKDDPPVVEEDGLDQLHRTHLEVPALPVGGKAPDRLGERGYGEIGEHGVLVSTPRTGGQAG